MNSDGKSWFTITVSVDASAVETVETAFTALDAIGTSVDLFNTKSKTVNVVGYFDSPPEDAAFNDALNLALQTMGFDDSAIRIVKSGSIADTDWLAEWKKYWKPTVSGRFVIAAPWHVIGDRDSIVIRIEPNMAFGTGTHETTQLCLVAIDEFLKPGDSFLDVGTGTGILAIAAAKIATERTEKETTTEKLKIRSGLKNDNSTSVISVQSVANFSAYDTDPDSIKIARENAELNGVSEMINFFHGPITEEMPTCDFVTANLTLDVILPILPMLIAKTNRILVLSGILAEQESAIADALIQHGISNSDIRRSGEWIATVIRINN
ncbi:MAG: 50S ribosomal protein L11 methyltransferase [Pyrinomonadaceae bacterium]